MNDSQSMEDVLQYFDTCSDKPEHATKAAFYFLYKEILVNRIAIFSMGDKPNRGGIEFSEKLINELNKKLMEQLQQK